MEKTAITELLKRDLRDVVASIKKGELTSEELYHFYRNRILERGLKEQLNCVCAFNEKALEDARKIDSGDRSDLPLCGLMVLVKDNIDVSGMPTTAGSIALKDNIAEEDAEIVRLLKSKGAVILGKTNLTEFANFLTQNMPQGFSSYGGQVVSAFGADHEPGGSSSGSGVAMCAGLCSFSVGTDTSFSVVGCASSNGVVGFKPSVGKLSIEGIVPITHHFDSPGFFTRSVRDMCYLYESLLEEPLCEVSLSRRFLINDFNREIVAEEQLTFYDEMIGELEQNGFEGKHIEGENTIRLKELMTRCFAAELESYLKKHGLSLSAKDILNVYHSDPERLAPYGTSYLEESDIDNHTAENEKTIEVILEDRKQKRKEALQELSEYDVCLMTGPTCMMHYTGMTSISVPIAYSRKDGLPRNMILYTDNEKRLLTFARILESLSLIGKQSVVHDPVSDLAKE